MLRIIPILCAVFMAFSDGCADPQTNRELGLYMEELREVRKKVVHVKPTDVSEGYPEAQKINTSFGNFHAPLTDWLQNAEQYLQILTELLVPVDKKTLLGHRTYGANKESYQVADQSIQKDQKDRKYNPSYYSDLKEALTAVEKKNLRFYELFTTVEDGSVRFRMDAITAGRLSFINGTDTDATAVQKDLEIWMNYLPTLNLWLNNKAAAHSVIDGFAEWLGKNPPLTHIEPSENDAKKRSGIEQEYLNQRTTANNMIHKLDRLLDALQKAVSRPTHGRC